jgi:protein-S-isoprenylcysteine O-methyltransferase Ste14
VRSSRRPFRSKIDWGELRLLFAYVVFFGTLLVMPLWSTIVLRQSNSGLAGVVAFIVGIAAFVVLWRYLGRPVRPEDERDDLLHRREWQRPDSR